MTTALEQTLIVVPAFNEEASLSATLREIIERAPGVTCLVVDDGSTDDTAGVAVRNGAIVASLPFNMGVGGAMRFGFKYAIAHGFRNVVQVDADGQHDPADVPRLIAELDRFDLAIGARFAGAGEYRVRGPRRWAMRLLSTVLSRTARTKLTDTTSGFKASGPKAVALFATNYPAEYLGDTIEALVIATRAGCTVTQVPVVMRSRTAGVPSHNPIKSAAYLGRALLALGFALFRPIAPAEKEVRV